MKISRCAGLPVGSSPSRLQRAGRWRPAPRAAGLCAWRSGAWRWRLWGCGTGGVRWRGSLARRVHFRGPSTHVCRRRVAAARSRGRRRRRGGHGGWLPFRARRSWANSRRLDFTFVQNMALNVKCGECGWIGTVAPPLQKQHHHHHRHHRHLILMFRIQAAV